MFLELGIGVPTMSRVKGHAFCKREGFRSRDIHIGKSKTLLGTESGLWL